MGTSGLAPYSATMPASTRWPWLLAPACLVAGLLVGRWLARDGAEGRVWTGSSRTAEPLAALPSLAPAVEKVARGVCGIRSWFPAQGAGPDAQPRSARNGSGFVIATSPSLLVVTSRHVVAGAEEVVLQFPDSRPVQADPAGEDAFTDLAVLRARQPVEGAVALELGRSEDLRAGDWIFTLGNQFGLRQTVTTGVVSHVGRRIPSYEMRTSNYFLQFSAPVNPGSSGSPVLDLGGRVVGVTTQAAEAAQGISFAIPSRTLKWVLDRAHESPDGRVHRAYVGISLETSRTTTADGQDAVGALITRVASGEPAERAGLQPGDLVFRADDQPIVDAGDLHEYITRSKPGSPVRFHVIRTGTRLQPIDVVLRELGTPQGENRSQ